MYVMGLEVKLHTFFMVAPDGCEWSTSHSRYLTTDRESLAPIIKKLMVITLWQKETNWQE
jgi:hypothetical protein